MHALTAVRNISQAQLFLPSSVTTEISLSPKLCRRPSESLASSHTVIGGDPQWLSRIAVKVACHGYLL